MDTAIELILSWIQKNPKLYAVLAALLIIVAIAFPYIDANFLSYNRIEKRVSFLQSLSAIDTEKISQHPALQEEYDAIVSEIAKQRELSVFNAFSLEQTTNDVLLFKFLTGGVLAWITALFVPLMNTFKDRKTKVFGFLLLILLGAILGGVGYIMPIIFNPWINYLGYPLLQLIALIALAIKPKQR